MKTSVCLVGLAVALLSLGVVHGQSPGYPSAGTVTLPLTTPANPTPPDPYAGISGPFPPPYAVNPAAPGQPTPPGPPARTPPELSSWITYARSPGCCGPLGSHGPIFSELYLRNGVSFPFGGFYGAVLDPGYHVEVGGRLLFFNPAVDAAWTVDVGASNVFWNAARNTRITALHNIQVPVPNATPPIATVPEVDVTLSNLNITFANIALGREWFLWRAGNDGDGPNLRFGGDIGARWGSVKADFNEIRHRTAPAESLFASVHSEFEYPCGFCILQAGLRGQFGVIWTDVLQSQNPKQFQTFDLMFTFGGRF
jgi:hypothetical protein